MDLYADFFELLHEKRTVPYVSVRAELVAHLYDVDFLSFVAQAGCQLSAYKAAAENYNLIANLIFLQMVILCYEHLVRLSETRDRRYHRFTSSAYDKSVRSFLLYICLVYSCVEADINSDLLAPALICETQLVHLVLERDSSFALQEAADFVGSFAENDFMTASCSCVGSIESARAAADYQYLSLYRSRSDLAESLVLSADERIYSTSSCKCAGAFRHACEAAQAAYDIVSAVFHDLVRKLRVSEEGTSHLNYVSFAGSDDLFHLCRIVESADSSYRLGNVLLDLSSEIDVSSMVFEP